MIVYYFDYAIFLSFNRYTVSKYSRRRLIRPPWDRDKLGVITVGRIIRRPQILYKCTFQPLKTIILSKKFLEDIDLPKQPII